MAIDKRTAAKLKKFAGVFKDAQERKANESDTVMFLIEFFKEVLQYDPLIGEITKEFPIKERRCDFSVVLKNKPRLLVEAKSADIKNLKVKHIEQAENYASRAHNEWVLLTNGVGWQSHTQSTHGQSLQVSRTGRSILDVCASHVCPQERERPRP